MAVGENEEDLGVRKRREKQKVASNGSDRTMVVSVTTPKDFDGQEKSGSGGATS